MTRRNFADQLTDSLDRRRGRESDVQYRVYRRPYGSRGLHVVADTTDGQEFVVSGPGQTFAPGAVVPTGRNSGAQGETILQAPPPGRRGASQLPPLKRQKTGEPSGLLVVHLDSSGLNGLANEGNPPQLPVDAEWADAAGGDQTVNVGDMRVDDAEINGRRAVTDFIDSEIGSFNMGSLGSAPWSVVAPGFTCWAVVRPRVLTSANPLFGGVATDPSGSSPSGGITAGGELYFGASGPSSVITAGAGIVTGAYVLVGIHRNNNGTLEGEVGGVDHTLGGADSTPFELRFVQNVEGASFSGHFAEFRFYVGQTSAAQRASDRAALLARYFPG